MSKKSKKGVPRREQGESLVAYHDRLSKLAADALAAGHSRQSERLQRVAGQLARTHVEVARRPRKDPERKGPGTYPWKQCVDDKRREVGDLERAQQICGRIRASSRARYSAYWRTREGKGNPGGAASGKPFIGLGYDGGPTFTEHPRDFVAVVDVEGTVLDLRPILGEHDLQALDGTYPGLPLFGPFRVLASQARELWRNFLYDTSVQVQSR